MASTYSALKIELLETGANSGTWGTATNVNLGDAVLGEAITGQATVDFATDADVTITLTDSATSQAARNLRLNITESSTGIGSVRNLILGSGCQIEKFYLINNTGTGAKTVKNTSGTGITVPAGKATLVFNNGTNVVDAASYFTSLTLGSALPVASGGTGLTAGTSGGIPAYTATGTLTSSGVLAQYGVVIGGGAGAVPTSTAVGTATHVLTSNGAGVAPTFQALPAGGVTTFTAGTTGFTPNTATTGAVTLAGTLGTANGGTNLTSFTSGGVVYASSTSALATGSALYFNGTSVGIGGATITDNSLLNIQGSNAVNNIGIVLNKTNGTAQIWGVQNSGPLVFFDYTTSAERMRLDTSGNLGLGVTPSAWSSTYYKVLEGGDSNNQSALGFRQDVNGIDLYTNTVLESGGNKYKFTAAAANFRIESNVFSWNQAASGTAGNAITFTQAMTLDASGNLNLGTTGSSNRLEVASSSNSTIGITRIGSHNVTLNAIAGGAFTIGVDGSGGGTVRFQLGSAGQWGIGGATYGTSGQVLTSGGASAAPTWATPASSGFTLGTPVATTSGTEVNFTGIPATVRQIILTFNGVSNDGGTYRIRIGDSGGLETTGYVSASALLRNANNVSVNDSTTGYTFSLFGAGDELRGSVTLTCQSTSANTWVASGVVGLTDLILTTVTGTKSLSGTLDRVSFQCTGGNFDAGSINIAYI